MSSNPLKRYYQILDGEERARYLLAKDFKLDTHLDSDDHLLWAKHEEARRSVRGLKGSVSFLDLKCELSSRMMRSCTLCERRCRTDRTAGVKGHCGVLEPRISSEFLHMGEEPELVPSYTIFFSGCTFNCVFCQNWDISTRPEAGQKVNPEDLVRMIEAKSPGTGRCQRTACAKNVNWVGGDPTSDLPYILQILRRADVNIPQVWNSNMYLSEDSMKLLDGIVDVYLTDLKYGNDACALRLSNAPSYMRIVTRNHVLARQNGEMIVRHLVLPGHAECCTRPALEWIASNLHEVKVNVMAQYRPAYKAKAFGEISKPLRLREYDEALRIAERLDLDLTE